MKNSRRKTLKTLGVSGAALGILGASNWIAACSSPTKTTEGATDETKDTAASADLFFQISLAQWSLHRSFFGDAISSWDNFGKLWAESPDNVLRGELKPIDFPTIAKRDFGVTAVEFVNTFYFSKKNDKQFWYDMRKQCDEQGVKSLLIMCDREGNLGDADEEARIKAVENHYAWVDAAQILGCHSIRVNAAGEGTAEEVKAAAIDGLSRLVDYAAQSDISVIVENHGGYSSNGEWLSSVIAGVGSKYCGTLPDFGNFCIDGHHGNCNEAYDKYKGVKELMPYAKGVSGKTHEFDADGNEVNTDFYKMLQIVKDAGFKGYIDIEYEGAELPEPDGIKATKALLEKAGKAVS
ncbi:MAG: xylose isomerase [Flammeovirgaceae bacterium]|nr:xylose isomerase [Flammeovirgaceae bacterium]MBE63248.1 xylose isomerase [Flammeovirgaceae bacterium]